MPHHPAGSLDSPQAAGRRAGLALVPCTGGLASDPGRTEVLQHVARLPLPAGGWILAIQPDSTGLAAMGLDPALLRVMALAAGRARAAPGCTLVRAAPAAFGQVAAPAILYHQGLLAPGVIYCHAGQITAAAATALAALVNAAPGYLPPGGLSGCTVTVGRVPHRELPDGRHPAQLEIRARDRQLTMSVCAREITRELADTLGVLYTAYASHLASHATPLPPARPARAAPLRLAPG